MKKYILTIIAVFAASLAFSYNAKAFDGTELPLPPRPEPTLTQCTSYDNPFGECAISYIVPGICIYVNCSLNCAPKMNPDGSVENLLFVNGIPSQQFIELLTDTQSEIKGAELQIKQCMEDGFFDNADVYNFYLWYNNEHFSNVFSVCKNKDASLSSCPYIKPLPPEEAAAVPESEEIGKVPLEEAGVTDIGEEEIVPTKPLGADKGGCSLNEKAAVGSFGTLIALFLIALTPLAFVKVRRKK